MRISSAAREIAEAFHDEYERRSDGHGWDTQEATRVPFDELPDANKSLMLDVTQALLDAGIIRPGGVGE